ncbi:MAG: hypothetical protein E7443_06780 [Ruminococcaceae bacterium]|nr:hypothetical protein [Oscillospiraceae bacterium]
MDKKVTGIVAYITWVGLLLAFILGDREGAKFHLNQALVLWIIGSVAAFIPWVGWIVSAFCFVCVVIGLISAINGEEKEIPLLGKIKILK